MCARGLFGTGHRTHVGAQAASQNPRISLESRAIGGGGAWHGLWVALPP
jgi:hypothetical protein